MAGCAPQFSLCGAAIVVRDSVALITTQKYCTQAWHVQAWHVGHAVASKTCDPK